MADHGANHESDLASKLKEEHDLAEIGRAANSTLELSELFELVAEALKNYVQYDRLAVSLIQPDNTVVRAFVAGLDHADISVATKTIDPDEVLPTDGDGALTLSDSDEFIRPGGIMDQLGLKSWAEVPIVNARKKIGYLAVRSRKLNAYGKADSDRLRRAVDQIAPAIVNAQLFQRVQDESTVREVLAELGRISTATLDIANVFPDISKIISRAIPYDRMVVSSVDSSDGSLVIEYVDGISIDNFGQGTRTYLSQGYEGIIEQVKVPVVVDESFVEHAPGLKPHLDWGRENGLCSWLIAPLVWRGETVAHLAFRSKQENAYGEDQLRTASLIADQLTGSIVSSLDYRSEHKENEIETALANVAFAVTQDLDLHKVYDRLAAELERLIPYDRLAVVHYDTDTRKLTLEFARGLEVEGDQPGDDVTDPVGPQHWESLVHALDDTSDTERSRALRELGLNSWVQAPIGVMPSGPDGFISLRSKQVGLYTDDDLALLKRFCEVVTPALQNARLFEQAQKLSEQIQRADYLDAQNIELQRLADARSEFLSSISHELRTPLTSISAFADILSKNTRGSLTEREEQQIDIIRKSTVTLTGLIDDLLDTAQADSNRLTINRAPFPVEEFFEEFMATATQSVAVKNQSLNVVDQCHSCWLDADRTRLMQVVNNLLSNAQKYSGEDSEITMSVVNEHGKLFVSFADNGIGISPNDRANLFSPFFRSDNPEARQQSGTGLGLTIVKKIVELHGGEIEVESELGEGTKITFWLPGVIEAHDAPTG